MFAGSGALGFEAMSRGAQAVTMIEASRIATQQLRSNAKSLGADNVTIYCGDAIEWLQHCSTPFDIVFLDPPFRGNLLASCLERLRGSDVLAPDALLYIEVPRNSAITNIDNSWLALKSKAAGNVEFGLYCANVR